MISKAQQKRDSEKRATLSRQMSRKLISFQSQYIGDYVNYEVAQIQELANSFKGSDIEKVKENTIGKTFNEVVKMKIFSSHELNCFTVKYDYKQPYNLKHDNLVESIDLGSVRNAQRTMEIIELEKVSFYVEAKKSFDIKFNKVIDKMCQYDFTRRLVIDEVSDRGSDFEILVWNPVVENAYTSDRSKKLEGVEFFFHARLIYANGAIKRPHFRFITTTRTTYLSK